jgi:hypothetical protein
LQEILPSDPVDQGDEGDWETVGEPAKRNRSPAPTVEELVLQLTQRSTTIIKPQAPVVRTELVVTAAAEEPAATQAEEETPAEAGFVDIASILGAPTVTVVRSSL